MCIWKSWKKPKTRIKNLIRCGIKPYWARIYGNSSKGYWANAELHVRWCERSENESRKKTTLFSSYSIKNCQLENHYYSAIHFSTVRV